MTIKQIIMLNILAPVTVALLAWYIKQRIAKLQKDREMAEKTELNAVVEPINDKIDKLGKLIRASDKMQTMHFLITEFARAERHELSEIEELHVKTAYDHYKAKEVDGGCEGNSYVTEYYERLKKEGRL